MAFVAVAAAFITAIPLVAWMAGAIYYDAGGGRTWARWLAIGWIVLAAVGLLFLRPLWIPYTLIWVAFVGVFAWWRTLQPRQDRDWDPNFSQTARVAIDKDLIILQNVRNTQYRSLTDYTVHYETRRYRLSELCGVDLLLLFWGSPWMSHPMFVFDFGPDGRVCVSVEVRYRRGQVYDFVRSLYRQQELMYVVSDERDAILRRTQHMTGHDLYLYRMYSDPLVIRQFLFEYTNSINRLAENPRWYHGLTENCTTGIYSQGRARIQWDWRMLLNGALDQMLYDRRLLDQTRPFDELWRLSRINEIANRAPQNGFGEYLREQLPGYRVEAKVCVESPN